VADGEFCVVCGRTGRPLTDALCAECAADRAVLVSAPQRAEVVICPTCGARRVGAHWERAGASPLLGAEDLNPFLVPHPEVALRHVGWEETGTTPTVRELVAHARVRFRGTERTVDVPMSVRIDSRTCIDCSRKSGRYFTAVLQLRGPADGPFEKPPALRARLEGEWQRLMQEARPDWRKAVSWREELPEGWDAYFTETLAARSVARLAKQKFGASLKESASLFGRKDGHDVYRVTLCVRFPRGTGPVRPRDAPVEP
jgi:nonsense-mediated mRNA decay protein 3